MSKARNVMQSGRSAHKSILSEVMVSFFPLFTMAAFNVDFFLG